MSEKKMSWNSVTLHQFLDLQEVLKIEDETERVIAIAELIYGENITDLPLMEFAKKAKELEFLKTPVPDNMPPKKIEVNGRKYYIDGLLGHVTTAQYIDYTNHAKANDICKMMSVFLIPEGHKYNDGYDMQQVFNDINDLPVPVVYSTAFFLGRQFGVFMRIFQRYSTKKIRKTNLPKKVKKQMEKVVESSVDLALSPLSSNSAK